LRLGFLYIAGTFDVVGIPFSNKSIGPQKTTEHESNSDVIPILRVASRLEIKITLKTTRLI